MSNTIGTRSIYRDCLIVGFAMFAVFFGAGNLIFPPQIGFVAGAGWAKALCGLLLTGMLLPVLTVIALGLCGGSVERLTAPIASWFGSALLFVSLVFLAWMIAVPRTASVAFETGFMTLAPSLNAHICVWIFIPLFFAVTIYFALDRSNVIDRIGRILTPLLLGLLGIIVIWSVLAPLGTPVDTGVAGAAPFGMGLITGYQTGDVFGGLMFGIIFIEAVRDRGYTDKTGFKTVLFGAAVVTFFGLLFVYGGLEYLGATGSGVLGSDVTQANLLTRLVAELAGRFGANALAIAVVLACLTTAVGATAVLAKYIVQWSGGRVSYRAGVWFVSLTSLVQSFGGVDHIVALAEPFFRLFYPAGICIVLLGILSCFFTNDGVWKGATLMAILMGFVDLILSVSGKMGIVVPTHLQAFYDALPLSSVGFAWLVPAIIGGVLGGVWWQIAGMPNVSHVDTF
ncbi:branched-chain amino acid transport system II carrier protein [Paracoccus aestuariivivens]|nr:branched-chain amino acid transport system II carrier protein [Paracoccus aestuariivivens]